MSEHRPEEQNVEIPEILKKLSYGFCHLNKRDNSIDFVRRNTLLNKVCKCLWHSYLNSAILTP